MFVTIHSFKGGTGKTFIALNLSYLLSKENKVCLIDFDFRAPSLHVFFGKDGVKYVNELLDGFTNLKGYLIEISENLSVMLASPNPEDIKKEIRKDERGEMRVLENLIRLKSELKDFDYVILDTAPGLSYRSLNALLVSDLILFVARADKLDIKGLETLLDVTKNIKTPKLVVLNRVIKKVDLSVPVAVEIPCSCDVSMDYPFFIERFPHCDVTKGIERLAELTKSFKFSSY